MKTTDYKAYFHAAYQGAVDFSANILEPMFGENEMSYDYNDYAQDEDKASILSLHRCGKYSLKVGDPIYFFDVTLADDCIIEKRLQIDVKKVIIKYMEIFSGAFIIFHYADTKNNPTWRLAWVEKQKGNSDTTSMKRYNYLCGQNYSCRTIAERFDELYSKDKTLENITKAFDVEALSKAFFDEYREHYADFVQYITGNRYVQVGNKFEPKHVGEENTDFFNAFGRSEKRVRDYVKKMMGRLVFLCFLQRKGWLGGNLHYLQDLFKSSRKKDDFIDSVLEPIFFGLLNTRPENRAKLFKDNNWDLSLIPDANKIPYLNGGLFEADENDAPPSVFPRELFSNPSHEGEPKNYTNKKKFDYHEFRGLFDFFDAYNFTIDENDPNDAIVGVDPEMLGKIFENLLEDNKDKGAFYTPKEIVQYMCRESLVAYLVESAKKSLNREFSKDDLKQLDKDIHYLVSNPEEAIHNMKTKQMQELNVALRKVKICDPAIGSGAFPVGLLNELVRIRTELNKATGELMDPATLKEEIIRNNIYGVDIEKGAIDIARLRFWLSIVVDLDKPEALPNFDYKFMEGNSLLTTFDGEYIDLGKKVEKKSKYGNNASQKVQEVEDLKKELAELQKNYYKLTGTAKYKQEVNIKLKIIDILEAQLKYEEASKQQGNVTTGILF